jgi:hypothetical protein
MTTYHNIHSSYISEDAQFENTTDLKKVYWPFDEDSDFGDVQSVLFEEIEDLVYQEQSNDPCNKEEALSFVEKYKEICLDQNKFFDNQQEQEIEQVCNELKKFVNNLKDTNGIVCCIYSFESDVNILISSVVQK